MAKEKENLGSNVDMDSIYRQYALPLKKFVCSMCYDSTLADDIVSETFYRAIKSIDSFYGGNIFTWLCTIAKNIYFNHTKKKESQNLSLDDEEQTVEIIDKITKLNFQKWKIHHHLSTTMEDITMLLVLILKECGCVMMETLEVHFQSQDQCSDQILLLMLFPV